MLKVSNKFYKDSGSELIEHQNDVQDIDCVSTSKHSICSKLVLKSLSAEVLLKKSWFQRGDPQECELCRTGVNVMYGHLRVDEVGHEMELLEMGVCQQLDDPQASVTKALV